MQVKKKLIDLHTGRQLTQSDYPFTDEAQNALFKDPVRTAL
jgi:hypothetical protein